jgi:choline dehydrogenase-like flavoprotein
MGDFDIVIVGAGPSAIGLLYGILTRPSLRSLTVAVIELGELSELNSKGESENHIRYWFRKSHGSQMRVPISLLDTTATISRTSILFPTTPQAALHNRVLEVPVGVGIGGGSNINAGFCTSPDFENDFQLWPGVWKNGTLIKNSIKEILSAMSESGGLSNWRVCSTFAEKFRLTERNRVIQKSVVQGAQSTFLPSFSMATNLNGQRISYYDSLLHPLMERDSSAKQRVKFFTGCAATRVKIVNKIATGVECIDMTSSISAPFIINARKEVILCAGAIMSPTLLILSGVGDRNEIDLAGVSLCHAHIPAVGKNLRDHILLPRAFLSPNQQFIRQSMNSVQAKFIMSIPQETLGSDQAGPGQERQRKYQYEVLLTDGSITWMMIPHIIASVIRRGASVRERDQQGYSIQNVIAYAGVVFFNTTCFIAFILLRSLIFLLARLYPVRLLIQHFTVVVNLCLLNPQSKGYITVVRNKTGMRKGPFAGFEVKVNPQYMADERDLKALYLGWRACNAIVEQHYKSCIELLPGMFRFLFKDWLKIYAAEFLLPYYHWIGTCAMGDTRCINDFGDQQQHQLSVVNDMLQVTELQKLRVCDASVFPNCISAPTALTCAGLGLGLSGFIT